MTRRKPTRPTKRHLAKAIKVLVEIAENPETPDYVRAKSANALLAAGSRDPEPEVDPDAPKVLIFLPAKRGVARPIGPQEGDNVVIFDSGSPEGRADCARWRAEAEARGDKVLAPQ